ncbi:MAG: hypothetical protein K0R22_45 [Sporomusa sp.]|jgi:hypothetical protein|nr:hypothetical protein [Sporomusa sp.]
MASDLGEEIPTEFLAEAIQYCQIRHAETQEQSYVKVAEILQGTIDQRGSSK